LPWAQASKHFPAAVVNRIKTQHHELRSLTRRLADVSSRKMLTRSSHRRAALCMLAVKLDDLIDSEETRLFAGAAKVLFA